MKWMDTVLKDLLLRVPVEAGEYRGEELARVLDDGCIDMAAPV